MAATTTPTPTSPRMILDARRDVRSRKQIFMARLLANRLAVLGGIIVILLVLIAIFGPLFAPHDPLEMAMANQFKPPSRTHWMGTDDFGRDVLSRLIYGSRQSLMVGVVSIAIGATVGMTIGLISGYVGGRTDMVVQRLIDVMLAFHDLLLALAIVAILLAITALGVTGLASFWVQQRTKQIGIRRALGATRRDILRYFQLENFLIVGAGVLLGTLLAFALNQWLMRRFELDHLDSPMVITGAIAVWLLGQLAVLGPALRAAAVPPIVATRSA